VIENGAHTLIDELLAEQRGLTAVERFARWHDPANGHAAAPAYKQLIPLTSPCSGEQYAFEVDLDQCSGCKACVVGCHSLNGLEEKETWRGVGLLIGGEKDSKELNGKNGKPISTTGNSSFSILHSSFQQHVTTACHHCVDPACLSGCPVKAYDKNPITGIVRHLDDQCIGCQYCVMKCPYEVPEYSSRLGIVRKCDMCTSRLAVGEAPACVQSCPNEAIRITVVKQDDVKAQFSNGASTQNSFLVDSPNPKITLPTTRYLSKNPRPGFVAADHAAPRLDSPHWPLVIMLIFTQAAAGMFLAAMLVPTTPIFDLVAFALLNIGLIAAPLHLGQPLKAWRAFLGWRTSWLSREIIAFNQFAPLAAAATALAWLPFLIAKFPKLGDLIHKLPAWLPPLEKFQLPLTLGAAVVGLVCVFVSGMVYVDTKRAFWSPRHSFGNFFGTTLLLGATLAAFTFACLGKIYLAQPFAMAALVIRIALFVWRRLELHAALKNPVSPVHLNARAIRELLSRTTPARTALFAASTIFGLLAIANVAGAVVVWTGAAALATLLSEIIARHVFFRAGAGKRMPGGIAA
jgi:Fe-S-cluster-containing dehydrogenase component/DMSO reductase anchor subunit